MRAEHDGVPGQQGDKDLEIHRRDRVGRRRKREHHACRAGQPDDPRRLVHLRCDEVRVPVVLEEPTAGQFVLDALVLGDAEPRLANRPFREEPGIAVAGIRDCFRYLPHFRQAVAPKGFGRPARAGENPRSAPQQRRARHRNIDKGRFRAAHALAPRFPATSSRARPMARSTRLSRSSDSGSDIRTPGLNCSTLGSSVEKIAQTPLR